MGETFSLPGVDDEERAPERVGKDGRYQLLHTLGRGGFGTVYKARDTLYGGEVAVKLLRRHGADALYRFKLEFRGLVDLQHRNLARLYELGSQDDRWFVVMEYVDGVDTRRHLTGAALDVLSTVSCDDQPAIAAAVDAPVDPAALRATFSQLAEGLAALHAAGKLHRDIKPSNVLVERGGRVVILDFGLVLDVGGAQSGLDARGGGTRGYMAPEQARGEALGPGCDWYAVGAMMRELLGDNGPDDLRELCRRLLLPRAEERPTADEILAVLGTQKAPPPRATSELVGRDRELAQLDAALQLCRERPVLVRVTGESGIGKSALINAWLAAQDVAVLRGRCLEHEDLPFKAIDGVVDALAALLSRHPPAEPLPSRGALLRMFPVLRGALGTADDDDDDDDDPQLLREKGLACLRELLVRVAPVIVCIDDAHWGDADGAYALAELMRPPLRDVLFVTLQRPGSAAFPARLEEWLQGVTTVELPLAGLDEEQARRLAASWLAAPEVIARVAAEAHGNPFFLRQFAAHLSESPGVGFAEWMEQRLGRLAAPARSLVEVVALAARPLAETVVTRAAGVDGADLHAALRAAEHERLVVGLMRDGQSFLEPAHDRIREEVTRLTKTASTHHARIAAALVAAGHHEPEPLLHHYLGAHDDARASDAALAAAERAERTLAFDRAAEYWQHVLRLGQREPERAQLLERYGQALSYAGRPAEAARALQDSAKAFTPGDAESQRRLRAIKRRSGELWLRSGYIDAGMAQFRDVLAGLDVKMPATTGAAIRMAVWRRLRLMMRGLQFTERAESDIAPDTLERLDAMWGATTSLGMLKFIFADAVGLQHFLEALAVGEPTRILRALAYEANFEALIGGPVFAKRSRAMLAEMDRVAAGIGVPYYRAWSQMAHGIVGWQSGDWRTAWEGCDRASAQFQKECRGVDWELAVCDVYRLSALTYLGRASTLAAIVPDAHRSARERGDLYAATNLAFYECFVLLAQDQPDTARRIAARAIEPFAREELLAVHYGISYAILQCEIYAGRVEEAWAHIERDWPMWEKIGIPRIRCGRIEACYARARAALALLASGRAPSLARTLQRTAAGDAKRLSKVAVPPAAPLAAAVRAALALHEGARDRAVLMLEEAAGGFDAAGMALHASAARHHRAGLVGEQTQAIVDGVKHPSRMFQLTIPGFPA